MTRHTGISSHDLDSMAAEGIAENLGLLPFKRLGRRPHALEGLFPEAMCESGSNWKPLGLPENQPLVIGS